MLEVARQTAVSKAWFRGNYFLLENVCRPRPDAPSVIIEHCLGVKIRHDAKLMQGSLAYML